VNGRRDLFRMFLIVMACVLAGFLVIALVFILP
jgi:hypothetical protein